MERGNKGKPGEQEITIRVIVEPDLPEAIHGVSYPKGDGYMVILNGSDTAERQEEAFLHELRHIWRGDHEKAATADMIEKEVAG